VPHEAVDLARREFALAGLEPTEVLRRNLTEALRVGFLYDNTSTWDPSLARCLAKLYGDGPSEPSNSRVSVLVEAAEQLGIELSDGQLARLDQLGAALREGNRQINLTRITDPGQIETRHFLDSLTAAVPLLERLHAGEPLRLVDVGSGGGMPGVPLKIAFPGLRVTLVESVGKKAEFLRSTVAQLGLTDVEVVAERAESLARHPEYRDAFDWATARALGPLPVVVELCAPFLSPGGLLVAQRSGDLDAEIVHAAPAFKALHLWTRTPIYLELAELPGHGLVVGEKYAPTPERYPRRPGLPRKHPLSHA
jgi:16S rRNA (guanine527-N7)-methyltransferase